MHSCCRKQLDQTDFLDMYTYLSVSTLLDKIMHSAAGELATFSGDTPMVETQQELFTIRGSRHLRRTCACSFPSEVSIHPQEVILCLPYQLLENDMDCFIVFSTCSSK